MEAAGTQQINNKTIISNLTKIDFDRIVTSNDDLLIGAQKCPITD